VPGLQRVQAEPPVESNQGSSRIASVNILWIREYSMYPIRGVEFNNFKIDPDKKGLGLIAQEVELIIPELEIVSVNEMDDIKCIPYNSLIGVLIEAIKEQQQQINEIKSILKTNLK
jgi:hypothetical protein